MTLQKETRDAIGRTVRSLRELFEGDFGKQASGRFGIRSSPRGNEPDGSELDAWLDPDESLSLTPAEFAQRNELIHALRYLTSEGNEPHEAVARLIREAAFTAVNRLLAIRVAETIGVLPPVLSSGRLSAGYRDTVGDLFPGLTHDADSYWTYLQVAGDELAPGVPRLFDRRHPTSAFVPSRTCVDGALELLTVDELADAWHEPETLGWGYQFFNGEDVDQMRSQSAAPRNARELAVRNQFFTPRYVVDWLVQNTLGRRLAQAGYNLELPLLVGEVGTDNVLALENVRVLDPAVGSGHFLLGSYDLLEQAWGSIGVPPEEAAAKILPCLFGVEIDPRAAQVAQAVLLLRACRSAPTANLPPPTVVTAVALPQNKELRDQAFGGLSLAARHLAGQITDALDVAPQLGTLLNIDQSIEAELTKNLNSPQLHIDAGSTSIVTEIQDVLGKLASNEASVEQRMFTAEATDALTFLDVCRQRYDVVLMNPPFGESIKDSSRGYLKSHYPDWWTELYACFLSKSFGLVREAGLIGMLSSSQYFITRRMRELRELIVSDWPPIAIVDLGAGVLAGATVNTALSVFASERTSQEVVYQDLTQDTVDDRERRMRSRNRDDWRRIDIRQFSSLDRTPFAFHVPDRILELWTGSERIEPDLAEVRKGQSTFDNFRFLRLAWEVPPSEAGWVRYQKGGDFKTYVDPSHLIIDWRDDGKAMKEYGQSTVGSTAQVMQASSYWGRPGLTAPHTSSIGFGVRLLPAGEIFGGKAVCIFPHRMEDAVALIGILNSTVFAETIRVFGRTRATEGGAIKSMPVGQRVLRAAREAGIESAVNRICEEIYSWEVRDEMSPYFASPFANSGPRSLEHVRQEFSTALSTLQTAQLQVDTIVADALKIDPDTVIDTDVTRRSDLIVKCLPWTARTAGKRWAEDVVSWAVGVAFGRWDPSANPREFSMQYLTAPVEPAPALSRKRPLGHASVLPLRGDGSLSECVEEVLDSEHPSLQDEVARGLGISSLSGWIEKGFFGHHFAKYSRSRRYAPIYWQLGVQSGDWGLWLHAPSLSRECLFAVARAARDEGTTLKERAVLARDRAGNDRDKREQAESLEDLADEVEKFGAVADDVAQSGWEPDLNDGFVLNAAPLEELFVDRKWRGQIAKHRKAMQKGDYPWATVQREFFEKRI